MWQANRLKEGNKNMQQKHLLVSASIAIMWLAVLFVGVYGGDITNETITESTRVPIVSAVALFAMIATIAVAWRGFRD
jgi:hypothetical protein